MKSTGVVIISLSALALVTCIPVASAQHMYDYSLGHVEIYGGINATPYNTLGIPDKSVYYSGGEDRKVYYGIIVGLGGRWSAEYRYADNNLNSHLNFADVGGPDARQPFDGDVSTEEYRLHYQVNRYLSVHIEDYHVKGSGNLSSLGRLNANHDRVLIGAQYGRPFDKKGKSAWWVGIGLGDRVQHAEAGVTFSINKHLNFDVSYQYTNVDRIAESHGMNLAVSSQGLYTGLSYCF